MMLNAPKILLLSLGLFATAAFAQESEDGDHVEATIRLMGAAEASLPDAVTREIELPASLGDDAAAVERAERGLSQANERELRRSEGLEKASVARSKGAEMAENAQENREERGRSGDRPEPPSPPSPPETPNPGGPPDNPGPPNGS